MRTAGRYAAAVLLLLLCGCGYSFSPGGEHIDRGIKTVYIESLANKTSESNIENRFRSAFVNWFIKTSRFQVVDQESRADAIWRGSVNTLTTSTLSSQTSNLAAEGRVVVVLELKFVERESGKVIWADRAFSAYQDYKITDVMNTDSARKNAQTKLAADAAEKAYRAMMSGF